MSSLNSLKILLSIKHKAEYHILIYLNILKSKKKKKPEFQSNPKETEVRLKICYTLSIVLKSIFSLSCH